MQNYYINKIGLHLKILAVKVFQIYKTTAMGQYYVLMLH